MAPTNNEIEKAIKFWLKTAKDNFETSKIMHKAGRYNFAMFMCQQTVEALFKGIYIAKHKDRPPYIHDLELLLNKIDIETRKDILEDVKKINPHYIKARYVEDRFDSLIYNKSNSSNTIKSTERIFQWFTKKMNLTS